MVDLDDLVDGIRSGRRAAVSRAITLVESSKPSHRAQAFFVRSPAATVSPKTKRQMPFTLSGVSSEPISLVPSTDPRIPKTIAPNTDPNGMLSSFR